MISSMLKTFWQEEEGQDMVEYALLLAFVALAGVSLLSGIKRQHKDCIHEYKYEPDSAATASS